jgi:hypothetical protein
MNPETTVREGVDRKRDARNYLWSGDAIRANGKTVYFDTAARAFVIIYANGELPDLVATFNEAWDIYVKEETK